MDDTEGKVCHSSSKVDVPSSAVGSSSQKTNDSERINHRQRRTFSELKRDVLCLYESCNRCYASRHALQQHIRLKHPSYHTSNVRKIKDVSTPITPKEDTPIAEKKLATRKHSNSVSSGYTLFTEKQKSTRKRSNTMPNSYKLSIQQTTTLTCNADKSFSFQPIADIAPSAPTVKKQTQSVPKSAHLLGANIAQTRRKRSCSGPPYPTKDITACSKGQDLNYSLNAKSNVECTNNSSFFLSLNNLSLQVKQSTQTPTISPNAQNMGYFWPANSAKGSTKTDDEQPLGTGYTIPPCQGPLVSQPISSDIYISKSNSNQENNNVGNYSISNNIIQTNNDEILRLQLPTTATFSNQLSPSDVTGLQQSGSGAIIGNSVGFPNYNSLLKANPQEQENVKFAKLLESKIYAPFGLSNINPNQFRLMNAPDSIVDESTHAWNSKRSSSLSNLQTLETAVLNTNAFMANNDMLFYNHASKVDSTVNCQWNPSLDPSSLLMINNQFQPSSLGIISRDTLKLADDESQWETTMQSEQEKNMFYST